MIIRVVVTFLIGLLAGGCTARPPSVSKIPWLPHSEIDRIAEAIRTIPLPTTRAKALEILAPLDVQKHFPRFVADGRHWRQDDRFGTYYMSVTFTDPSSQVGSYRMILYFSLEKKDEDVELIEIRYSMPRGRVGRFGDCEEGFREFSMRISRPNQPVQPTLGSVTPRATSSTSK